jgi:hypothetical protein
MTQLLMVYHNYEGSVKTFISYVTVPYISDRFRLTQHQEVAASCMEPYPACFPVGVARHLFRFLNIKSLS